MIEDALTRAAIEVADRARTKAVRRWTPAVDDPDATEAAEEAVVLGAEAIQHLDAARWDEAVASAQQAAELDELHGTGECWREFALLVEEAAETGRPV